MFGASQDLITLISPAAASLWSPAAVLRRLPAWRGAAPRLLSGGGWCRWSAPATRSAVGVRGHVCNVSAFLTLYTILPSTFFASESPSPWRRSSCSLSGLDSLVTCSTRTSFSSTCCSLSARFASSCEAEGLSWSIRLVGFWQKLLFFTDFQEPISCLLQLVDDINGGKKPQKRNQKANIAQWLLPN